MLGGLLEDVIRESDQSVPYLSKIPLLGGLFRSRKTEKVKTNLLVFIRPKILRDTAATSLETNQKYNQMRNYQQIDQSTGIPLMPGLVRPTLPELTEQDILNEGVQSESAQDEEAPGETDDSDSDQGAQYDVSQ